MWFEEMVHNIVYFESVYGIVKYYFVCVCVCVFVQRIVKLYNARIVISIDPFYVLSTNRAKLVRNNYTINRVCFRLTKVDGICTLCTAFSTPIISSEFG